MKREVKLLTKLKLRAAKLANVKLAEFQSGDLVLYVLDGEELAKGVEVFIMDDEGAYVYPENGSYPVNGEDIVIEDGYVVDIVPISPGNVDPGNPNPSDDEEVTAEDFNDLVEVVTAIAEQADGVPESIAEMAADLELMKQTVKRLEETHAEDKKTIDSMSAELKLAKQRSRGEFTKPNPSQKPQGGNKTTLDEINKRFGL